MKGNDTLKTLQKMFDHGMSVTRMCEIYSSRSINKGSLRKFYGEPSDNQTEGMTIDKVADRLEDIVSGQEIYLAEWSTFRDHNIEIPSNALFWKKYPCEFDTLDRSQSCVLLYVGSTTRYSHLRVQPEHMCAKFRRSLPSLHYKAMVEHDCEDQWDLLDGVG